MQLKDFEKHVYDSETTYRYKEDEYYYEIDYTHKYIKSLAFFMLNVDGDLTSWKIPVELLTDLLADIKEQ